MSISIVVSTPKKRGKKPPSHPNFFGEPAAKPAKLREAYPEHWQRYWDTFIRPVDQSWFYKRTTIDGNLEWRPAFVRSKDEDGRLKTSGYRPTGSCTYELEQHLGGPRPNKPVVWLGTFGGKYTQWYFADVDNHVKDRRGWHCPRRGWIQVGDLSIPYLCRLKTIYETLLRTKRPTVLLTSSRSLGVSIYQWLDADYWAPTVQSDVLKFLERRGIIKLEVFPMYDDKGKGCRCNRVPFGDGSFTLAQNGIIRDWKDQLDHFVDPGEVPSFTSVCEMLIELWVGQYKNWNHAGKEERDRHKQVVSDLRDWVKSGCPVVADPVEEKTVAPKPVKEPAKPVVNVTQPVNPTVSNVSWVDRVYRLAAYGLQESDSLNPSLFALAKHLLGIELYSEDDKEEITFTVLERFCLTKHNGMSSRLDGCELGSKIEALLRRTIKNAFSTIEADQFAKIRERTYSNPLRVRWLVCRDGKENRYVPPGENTHTNLKGSIYSVPDSTGTFEADLDHPPLPETFQARVKALAGRKPAKTIQFVTRFTNFLRQRNGVARVNQEHLMKRFLGYKSKDKWTRFKAIGIQAGVFKETDGYSVGEKSKEYTLLPETNEAIETGSFDLFDLGELQD